MGEEQLQVLKRQPGLEFELLGEFVQRTVEELVAALAGQLQGTTVLSFHILHILILFKTRRRPL